MSDDYRVYRAYDEADRLLYVGCTNNPASRMSAHANGSLWYPYHRRIEFDERMPRAEARAREYEQINTLSPVFGRTAEKQREHMRWVRAVQKFESDWNSQTIPHEWDADFATAFGSADLKGREYRPEHDLETYLAVRSAACPSRP